MTHDRLCMTPGPVEFDARVLEAMKHEGISHTDPTFINVFGRVLEQLRDVFLAPDGQPLVVAGSGTLGWDMVAANLVCSGDNVLVVNTGTFGDGFGDCLEQYGATVTHVRAPAIGSRPRLDDIRTQLQRQQESPFKLVTITHVDTSTGVLVDVKNVATLIRQTSPSTLIVVDGVCALGGEECRMQAWDLDIVLTASQKCLGVPAGLSLLMLRPRVLQVFEVLDFDSSCHNYYTNWKHWLPIMKAYEARQACYFATPPVNHIFALHQSLTLLLANGGIERRFHEHRIAAVAMQQALKALGLSLVTTDGCHAHTLSCVRFPTGVQGPEFLKGVAARGVVLAGGLHQAIKTQYFRIGHMGPSSRCVGHLMQTLEAIEQALIECKFEMDKPGQATAMVKAVQSELEAESDPWKHSGKGKRSCVEREMLVAVIAGSLGVLCGLCLAKRAK